MRVPLLSDALDRTAGNVFATERGSTRPPTRVATWVERCVNRLKQWRGIATRYKKRATNYRATVVFAALVVWLCSYSFQMQRAPELRFSAKVGQEPEIELALV